MNTLFEWHKDHVICPPKPYHLQLVFVVGLTCDLLFNDSISTVGVDVRFQGGPTVVNRRKQRDTVMLQNFKKLCSEGLSESQSSGKDQLHMLFSNLWASVKFGVGGKQFSAGGMEGFHQPVICMRESSPARSVLSSGHCCSLCFLKRQISSYPSSSIHRFSTCHWCMGQIEAVEKLWQLL